MEFEVPFDSPLTYSDAEAEADMLAAPELEPPYAGRLDEVHLGSSARSPRPHTKRFSAPPDPIWDKITPTLHRIDAAIDARARGKIEPEDLTTERFSAPPDNSDPGWDGTMSILHRIDAVFDARARGEMEPGERTTMRYVEAVADLVAPLQQGLDALDISVAQAADAAADAKSAADEARDAIGCLEDQGAATTGRLEALSADLAEVRAAQGAIEARLGTLEAGLGGLRADLGEISATLRTISGAVMAMAATAAAAPRTGRPWSVGAGPL